VVVVLLVKSESMLGQGSGRSVLGGFGVLGLGCGVASSWVLGSGFWVLGDMCLMLGIDSWFSAFAKASADESVFAVTMAEEESFWVSAFVTAFAEASALKEASAVEETSVDKGGGGTGFISFSFN